MKDEMNSSLERYARIKTLGELKKSGYKPVPVKEEIRKNLLRKIRNKENPFTGIIGYDDSVIPDTERALLSRHNILFLGLRGQAKTRMARLITDLLDEYIPVIAGSEVNDVAVALRRGTPALLRRRATSRLTALRLSARPASRSASQMASHG